MDSFTYTNASIYSTTAVQTEQINKGLCGTSQVLITSKQSDVAYIFEIKYYFVSLTVNSDNIFILRCPLFLISQN